MKFIVFSALVSLATLAHAAEPRVLSADQLKARVVEINDAQNAIMMSGSSVADADKAFAFYTDDFTYVHEVHGGLYTREELYANTVKFLRRGSYNNTKPRYTIVSMIPGHNGIAVERREVHKGVATNHLAVFEFRGDKVSKIIEYWK